MTPAQSKDKKSLKITRKQRLWGLLKFILFAAFLMGMAIIGGLLEFTRQVSAQSRPDPVPNADGIVVWTGPGGGRLDAGTYLLSEGKGERLLISGVNAQNSREDIIAVLGLTEDQDDCCLDLDYAAIDTVGNARETASWAQALGYEHIILVTSDFHMPRAQLEITAAAGRIRITPYPVTSAKAGPWWRDRDQFSRLSEEYGKLLGSFARRPRKLSHDPKVPAIATDDNTVNASEPQNTPDQGTPEP